MASTPVSRQTVLDRSEGSAENPVECVLEIAALLEGTTHISGIGWRLETPTGTLPIRTETRRFGRTLIYSDLAALRGGLSAAARAGCRRVVVRTSNPNVERLLRGDDLPRLRRAAATARRMRPLLNRFENVRSEVRVPQDADLLHAVGEALDSGLHAAAEREEHRVHIMERIVERAKTVELEQKEGGWIANGRYHVHLEPMRCECPAWTVRWARAPVGGRRAQRLPCKHIVALALRSGISVPADLARLARRAPP